MAEHTFKGIGPDGNPATFRFAEGRWYENVCPDCGEINGGGIESEHHGPADDDPYSPTNAPCMWCGKGPMVVVYDVPEGGESVLRSVDLASKTRLED